MAYTIDHFPGRLVHNNGKPYRYFGGTAYLGLQTDAEFQELLIANIRTYGTNYGASRKSNVQLNTYGQAETYFAEKVGSEACLTLSSGYMAGRLVTGQFDRTEYHRYFAPNTHSALRTEKDVCFLDYKDLNTAITKGLSQNPSCQPVVFLDAIDFSGMNYPDFNGLKQLPLNELILVLDDSHGIGVVGRNGEGVFRSILRLKPKEVIVCCSLGKALATQAGAIFANKDRIQQFGKTDSFIGASPATPAAITTLIQSDHLVAEKRIALLKNINHFLAQLKKASHFAWMKDHPAFSFSDPRLGQYLFQNRFIITNFNYPNERASVVNRIVINAAHTKEDISLLAKTINTFE